MVTITINGKKKEREFQNMAQALAFAYQSGECYNAEKVELAYAVAKTAKKPGEKPNAGVDSADQAVIPQNDNAAGPDATEPRKDGDGSVNSADNGTGETGKEAGVDSADQAV